MGVSMSEFSKCQYKTSEYSSIMGVVLNIILDGKTSANWPILTPTLIPVIMSSKTTSQVRLALSCKAR